MRDVRDLPMQPAMRPRKAPKRIAPAPAAAILTALGVLVATGVVGFASVMGLTGPAADTRGQAPAQGLLGDPDGPRVQGDLEAPASGKLTPSATSSAASPSASSKQPSPDTSSENSDSGSDSGSDASSGVGSEAARMILRDINAERAKHNAPALVMDQRLINAGHKHNLTMAGSCGMAHECPGEPQVGDRITNAGFRWRTYGENIGYSGPVPNTTKGYYTAGDQNTDDMFAEVPPNDGHRRNLLNKDFKYIGIDLYRDSKGTVWMTQDFAA